MSIDPADAPRIFWDFYAGAYGPSMLIVLRDRRSVERMQDLFVEVATDGQPLELRWMADMFFENIDSLVLARSDDQVRRTFVREDPGRFRWSCSAQQWHHHAALLDGFARGRAGHHYLTEEAHDDALIEISFGEEHPGVP